MDKSKVRVLAGTALASGAAWLAVSTPVFPAVFVSSASPPASIDLQTQATLQARGARVLVPVTVLCSGPDAQVHVSVSQRAGSVIISGYGHLSVQCKGVSTTVAVPVDASSRPFKNGPAAATADLYTWNIDLQDNDIIQIKK